MLLNIWTDITGNTTNLINTFTSIGTFTTAIITYLVINETRKQRQGSYRPEIHLDTSSAKLISPTFQRGEIEILYEQSSDAEKQNQLPWIYTNIYNIGLGAAKELTHNFHFDFDQALSLIRELVHGSPLEFWEQNNWKREGRFFSVRDEALNFSLSVNESPFRRDKQKNFILPGVDKASATTIHLYDEYLNLLHIYLFLKQGMLYHGRKPLIMLDMDELPKLYLHLSYRDIQNKQYHKTFNFKFSYLANDFNIMDQETIEPLTMNPRSEYGSLVIYAYEEHLT